MTDAACPLCASVAALWFTDNRRSYQRCHHCGLVFVPELYHLTPAAEKAEYDLHQNDPLDAGYRQFLSRVTKPLIARLPPQAQGLDFGCGPGPALAIMLEEAGFICARYDIFYFPEPSVLKKHYQFITMTEVIEHLARPRAELDRLWAQLLPGGVLAIMTKRVRDQQAFAGWHYKNDQTHIAFFAEQTFHYLAEQWQARVEFFGGDVVLLTKPDK